MQVLSSFQEKKFSPRGTIKISLKVYGKYTSKFEEYYCLLCGLDHLNMPSDITTNQKVTFEINIKKIQPRLTGGNYSFDKYAFYFILIKNLKGNIDRQLKLFIV